MKNIFIGLVALALGLISLAGMFSDHWGVGFVFLGLMLGAICFIDNKKWHYDRTTHHFRKR